MLPVAGIENPRFGERARARAVHARRAVRRSLALATVVLAITVGAAQTALLCAIHGVVPSPLQITAVVIVLGSLACLWVGTFAFVRLVTGRGGGLAAAVTTLAFYGLALPLGTDDTLVTMAGLVPVALIATRRLTRLPWPPRAPRPSLPRA